MTLVKDILRDTIGILVICSGLAGGIFAFLSWRVARRVETTQNKDSIPRPKLAYSQAGDTLQAQVFNVGGIADPFLVLVHAGKDLFYFRHSLPQHSPQGPLYTLTHVGNSTENTSHPREIFLIAKDSLGQWWEYTNGVARQVAKNDPGRLIEELKLPFRWENESLSR